MIPYDPSVGEFPHSLRPASLIPALAGDQRSAGETHAVLEVRSHDVPSLLEDGQIVCRLVYEQLLAPPKRLYGKKSAPILIAAAGAEQTLQAQLKNIHGARG